MKASEGKGVGNDNTNTPVVEVKEEEREEVQKESPNLSSESSTYSQNAEMVDLSECSTGDLITAADGPSCKQIRVDFERIIMGEKLSDLDINAAQRILKLQFPNIHGLESTLYQMKERKLNEAQVKNKIQIIHCLQRQHWIVATTVGCEANVVKV